MVQESEYNTDDALQRISFAIKMRDWEHLQDIISSRKIPTADLTTKCTEKWSDGSPKTVLLIDPLSLWPIKRLGYYQGGQDLYEETDLFVPLSPNEMQDEQKKCCLDGVSILYYSDGAPLRISSYTQGVLNGIEKQFFPDGSLAISRAYLNGKIEGEECVYWPSSSFGSTQVRTKQSYLDGKLHGISVSYDKDGAKESEKNYKNGLLHGTRVALVQGASPYKEITTWHSGLLHDVGGKAALIRIDSHTQKTIEERHFLFGTSHGFHICYHPNGVIRMKTTYCFGKEHGQRVYFSNEGKKVASAKYVQGLPVGNHTIYDAHGETLLRESSYLEDGRGTHINYSPSAPHVLREKYTTVGNDLDGEYTLYSLHDSTIPELSLSFVKGQLHGRQVRKNPRSGSLLYEYSFNNGVRDGVQKEWDENGDISLITSCTQGFYDGSYKEWYPCSNTKKMKRQATYQQGDLDGLYEEWFETGQIKIRGEWRKGCEEGVHEEWNQNGIKIAEVEFLHGALHGHFLEWYDSGMKRVSALYKNGLIDGLYQEWYPDGKLAIRATYASGNIHGQLTQWHEDGHIEFEGTYTIGVPCGEHVRYYCDDEAPAVENMFSKSKSVSQKSIVERFDANGLYDGDQVSYYPNGMVKAISSYSKGVLEGEKKRFNEVGEIVFSAQYLNGRLHGSYYHIHSDGIKEDRHYTNGLPEGTWTTWATKLYKQNLRSEGQETILAQATYSKGKIEGEYREYYPDGDLSLVVSFKNGLREGPSAIYSPEGRVVAITQYKNGNQDGEMILYYPSGAILRKCYYTSNYQQGEDITFYENGKIKSSSHFEKGRLDGQYKEFSQEGMLIFEGMFQNGKRHGIFKKYLSDGSLKVELYYTDGQLVKRKSVQAGK